MKDNNFIEVENAEDLKFNKRCRPVVSIDKFGKTHVEFIWEDLLARQRI